MEPDNTAIAIADEISERFIEATHEQMSAAFVDGFSQGVGSLRDFAAFAQRLYADRGTDAGALVAEAFGEVILRCDALLEKVGGV